MEGQAERPSAVLARQVRHWRERRKLSAQALAQRLSELGAPTLNRRSISKIENGERGVTLDEWLQLAHALGVPPPLLFLDLRAGADVRIADQVVVHPWLAWTWVVGETPPVMTDRTVARVEEFANAKQAVELYRREARAANAVHNAQSIVRSAEFSGGQEALQAARSQYADALRDLARCLDDMTENGGMEPPGLPRDWVETMRSLELLRYPDRVKIFELQDGDDAS